MYSSAFNFRDGDFILRSDCSYDHKLMCSSESIDFRIHRCILSAASPVFDGMFTIPQPASDVDIIIPVVPVTETSAVLDTILRFVYPVANPVITTLDELGPALEAARKYDFGVAIDALRKRLIAPDFLKSYPLRVFGIANRFELAEEARVASRALLNTALSGQHPHEDLKHVTAYDYHQLVVAREQRAHAAIELLQPPRDLKCMQCNGRWDRARDPPRWWVAYKERAKEELRLRPTSDVIFSLSFLQQSAQTGCVGCPASILSSSWFFDQLKCNIDDLPTTL
ncbi:hypothetical protein C8Q79DRAFT_381604 [Trametes meyenii]|nr:hypothetical protein C8Q79DRAFT_381604 [Trametes meyenii]